MNFAFSSAEEDFRHEVRDFLEDYRDLDGFFRQGHRWPQVKAMFQAMAERLAARTFAKGERVEANWNSFGQWYPGVIADASKLHDYR